MSDLHYIKVVTQQQATSKDQKQNRGCVYAHALDTINQYTSSSCHLPTEMPGVMVPMLVADHGYCRTDWSKDNWLRMRLNKLMFAGASSGSGASPSRYCMTCLMVGLSPGNGCEHINPSVSTIRASSTL